MSKRPIYYNVNPRFTCGSPAQVSFDIARRVADQERQAYDHLVRMDPGHVDVQPHRLEGIVEERVENADHWFITDMLTAKQFIRMFPVNGFDFAATQKKKASLQRRFPGMDIRTVDSAHTE